MVCAQQYGNLYVWRFRPDATIALIDKYFGGLKPNPELPKLDLPKEAPITQPVVKEVIGPEPKASHWLGDSPVYPTRILKSCKSFRKYYTMERQDLSTLT